MRTPQDIRPIRDIAALVLENSDATLNRREIINFALMNDTPEKWEFNRMTEYLRELDKLDDSGITRNKSHRTKYSRAPYHVSLQNIWQYLDVNTDLETHCRRILSKPVIQLCKNPVLTRPFTDEEFLQRFSLNQIVMLKERNTPHLMIETTISALIFTEKSCGLVSVMFACYGKQYTLTELAERFLYNDQRRNKWEPFGVKG